MVESPILDDADALQDHFTSDTYRGREYEYLESATQGVERGTARIEGSLVRGYPSTPRVLVLDPGVQAYFDGPLAVEEKLNGYNVRIAHVGEPLAVTRSGRICPYTTRVAREQLDLQAFFAAHPDRMLAAEFVGPENPYTAHEYDVDAIEPRVFDVRHRETGQPMPVERRRAVADRFDFPQPELFGVVDPSEAAERVRAVIEDLSDRGREGVVMQSMDGRDLLKYTTGAIHRNDLASAFALPFDYGRDFLFPRVIREGFQAVEFDETGPELEARAHALGEAILEPMVETIRDVQAGETVGEDHTVRGSPEAIGELLAHLEQQGLELEIEADRRQGEERVVQFCKVSNATQDKIRHFLEGGTVDR